jgi:phage tail-like protein
MTIVGTPRTFHKKFAFVVEIEGVASAMFTKCSALEAEVATIENWEGGSLIATKEPGRVTISDVTLERGVAQGDSDLWNWFQQVVKLTANMGVNTPTYKRPVDIVQLDRNGAVLRRWTLQNAWPKKITVGEWDNGSDENAMEMVVLAFDSFDKVFG